MNQTKSSGVVHLRALAAAGLMAIAPATLLRTASAAEAESSANQQGWAVSCAAVGHNVALNCAAEQKVIAQETGQAISGVSVRVPGDSRKPAIVFLFPFGLYLPAGLKAQVDEGPVTKLEVQTCEPTGCFASVPSPAGLLKSMRAGKTLVLSGVTMGKEPFRMTHPLEGFKTAFDSIK